MTFRIAHVTLLTLLLAACAGGPPPQAKIAYYDVPGIAADVPAPLRSLDVVPASWLASSAMHYRLAYADSNRREHFVESRWTAQPAEMLTIRLQRSLMSGKGAVGAAPGSRTLCRLRVDLDDFVQIFDSTSSSRLSIEGRLTLVGAQQAVLARRAFSLSQPAGADARGGVTASGPLFDALARELQAWVIQGCKPAP